MVKRGRKRAKDAPALGAAAGGAKKLRRTETKLHEHTSAAPTGAGAAVAGVPRRARAVEPWDLTVAAPQGIPPAPLRCVCRSAAAAATLEVRRAKAVEALRKALARQCEALGLDAPPQLALERWRFACKLAEEQGGTQLAGAKGKRRKRGLCGVLGTPDPLLPCGSGVAGGDGGGLVEDLVRAGVDTAKAERAAEELHAASVAEAAKLEALARRLVDGGDAAATAAAGRLSVARHRHSLDYTLDGCFVKLTHAAHEKLVELHRRHCASPGTGERADAVDLRLFALLLRYKTLHGHGFQAAAGPPVFRLLHERLGVTMECFASPLNAYFARFCSAFPDVDAPFGSAGSFWSCSPRRGSFEVNPPFVPYMLDRAAARCVQLLDAAEDTGDPLAFCFVQPGWTERVAWTSLSKSAFLRLRVVVAAADHGFCDGTSHQRQDPFRTSPYDTGVFVLQTSAAATKWPVGEALEPELRAAFAQCLPSQAAAKRQGRAA
ncbi:phosphorylated CTD-interacting factor 1 [Pseudoscourfieldia marina]